MKGGRETATTHCPEVRRGIGLPVIDRLDAEVIRTQATTHIAALMAAMVITLEDPLPEFGIPSGHSSFAVIGPPVLFFGEFRTYRLGGVKRGLPIGSGACSHEARIAG